jgi:hypothetical protein
MPRIKNGKFVNGTGQGKPRRLKTILKERFRLDRTNSRAFLNSICAEQVFFTRKEDKERVMMLLTYFICRVEEVLRPGGHIEMLEE